MANEKTKYTHITARCSQLLKALTYVTLERCTGDTLSSAYWRLKEGKGLLTYKDKESLKRWSDQITLIRRFYASPVPLSKYEHERFYDIRDRLLTRMEAYRDWLALGSMPLYLTVAADHDYSEITLEMAVGELNPQIIDADPETQKEFWRSLDIEEFLRCDKCVHHKVATYLKNMYRSQALDKIGEEFNYHRLPTDKVWQIRTDMEHRSSVGAAINDIMYWMYDVHSKSIIDSIIMDNNKTMIDRFIQWKANTKKLLKEKRTVEGDILQILESFADSIKIPHEPEREEEF